MPPRRRPAFTLIELLVVITIIAIVSAVALPTLLPALNGRQVSETARLLQASIEGARDAAIRSNSPRGIRLLPDPAFPGGAAGTNAMLAYSRIIPIEPAPDYTEGKVSIRGIQTDAPVGFGGNALRIEESRVDPMGLPNARTSWYWNVRVGDRMQIGGIRRMYTIVGPEVIANPERFVNVGNPGTTPTNPNQAGSEYLFLVNGVDDDGDGYVDEGFDGVNNDGNTTGTLVDELAEWESEAWVPPLGDMQVTTDQPYIIKRRPVPTQGARVIPLPSNMVVDASSWDSTQERSRLPLDPGTFTVEVMVAPNGQVIPNTFYSSPAAASIVPFLHFWVAERGDVHPPTVPAKATPAGTPRLPMPEGVVAGAAATLKGGRRLVSVNMRSGNVVSNEVETFDPANVNAPYFEAQSGSREAK